MSVIPLQQRTDRRARNEKLFLRSISDLYDKIASSQYLPPQAIEAEQSVLGSAMLDKVACARIIVMLGDPRDIESPFYREAHSKIYEAMVLLYEKQEPVDILQVSNQLREMGKLNDVGGSAYIVDLTQQVVTTANVEAHCLLIKEKFMLRELIRSCEYTKLKAFIQEYETNDILLDHSTEVFNITQNFIKKRGAQLGTFTRAAIQTIPRIQAGEIDVLGIQSGLMDLDDITGGWKKTDLIIIAARPGQGKTAFALQQAKDIALEKKLPVIFFSLEMGAEQLAYRTLANQSGVSANRMQRKHGMKHEELLQVQAAAEKLHGIPLYIDDTPAVTPLELRARCRMQQSQTGLSLVVVDYLQLMDAGKSMDSREREISYISRSLKTLAKELEVPVIALSQLNRMVEAGTGHKRPNLSHLRESGAIEADADLVLFLYRPETYGFDTDEQGRSTAGVAEVIAGKHRNGPIGIARTQFNPIAGIFRNLAPQLGAF